MSDLGRAAVSYERGTPVNPEPPPLPQEALEASRKMLSDRTGLVL